MWSRKVNRTIMSMQSWHQEQWHDHLNHGVHHVYATVMFNNRHCPVQTKNTQRTMIKGKLHTSYHAEQRALDLLCSPKGLKDAKRLRDAKEYFEEEEYCF